MLLRTPAAVDLSIGARRTAVAMSYTIRTALEGTVVRLSGDLDVMSAPQLRERLADLVRRGHYDLVVDLENVSFLDSSGLAVLVHALKRTRAHDGSLRLVCSDEPLLQILRITGLNRILTIHPTTAEALAAVESRETPPGLWADNGRASPPARLSLADPHEAAN